MRSIWERFQRPTRWEYRRCVWALDCLYTWLPVVITLSICSNSVHLQVCILISAPKRLFSHSPKKNQRAISWKLEIIFPISAAALCRWGGQINNFCVAYFLSILYAEYCRNRSIYVLCRLYSKMNRGTCFLTHTVHHWRWTAVMAWSRISNITCHLFVWHRVYKMSVLSVAYYGNSFPQAEGNTSSSSSSSSSSWNFYCAY